MAVHPETLLREMQARATQRVLQGNRWLTAEEVAELGHRRHSNAKHLVARWRRDLRIFSISLEGGACYPDYGLDPDSGFRPRPELRPLLEMFGEVSEGWRLAFWFDSPNSYLDGCRPRECYWLQPAQTLMAAQMEVLGPQHG